VIQNNRLVIGRFVGITDRRPSYQPYRLIDNKSLSPACRSSRNDYGVTFCGRGHRGAYVGKRRAAGVNSRRLRRARHGQKQCSEKGAEPARHGATWLEKGRIIWRSEEHTSELQSLAYLVCRLLLEKKNKKPELSRI